MSTKKIVITGGPSTGKTSVINYLEQVGFTCLHEVIRSMTSEKKDEEVEIRFKTNPIVSVSDPAAFNRSILDARIAQYGSVYDATENVVFFDRGIPDVLAYMDCFDQKYGAVFEQVVEDLRYDAIFMMPPWQQIYTSDNERFESFEESEAIGKCLFDCYSRFGYAIKTVPKMSVAQRANFILDQVKNI